MSDTNFSKVRNVAILSPWDVRVYSNVIICISGMCTHMRPTVHSVFASNVRCCSPCDSVPDWCMFLINFLYIISFNRRFFWSESFNLNLQDFTSKALKGSKAKLRHSWSLSCALAHERTSVSVSFIACPGVRPNPPRLMFAAAYPLVIRRAVQRCSKIFNDFQTWVK